jgi:hypothetical protein
VTRPDDGFYQYEPDVDLLNVHYLSHRHPREGQTHVMRGVWPAMEYRFGAVAAFVAARGPHGKPVSFDEDVTGIIHREPPRPHQNRLEAWESFVGGCVAYDHLDFTFTTNDPTGSAQGAIPAGLPREWFDGRPLRRWLGHLVRYAAELDLATLRPDPLAVAYAPIGTGAVAARAQAAAGGGGAGAERRLVYPANQRAFGADGGVDPVGGALWLAGLWPDRECHVRALDPRSGAWRALPPLRTDATGAGRLALPPFLEDTLVEVSA